MQLVHQSEKKKLDNARAIGAFIDPSGVTRIDNLTTAVATSDGLTTGLLLAAPQFVTVTSSSANNIISLPTAAQIRVGNVIEGVVGSNGFKLQVAAGDASTVTLNGVTTSVKAAIPANVSFKVQLINSTAWILTTTTALGAGGTAIVPA